MNSFIASLIRHLISAALPMLAAKGLELDNATVEGLIVGLSGVAGAGLSWYLNRKKQA